MTATLPFLTKDPAPSGAPPPLAATSWTAPRVNLMLPEVVGRRAVRRAQRGGAVAAGATVLVLAVVGVLGAGRVSAAQDALDTASARVGALRAQQAEYAAAPQVIARLDAAREAQATAMADDVRWYSYVDSLTAALPAGAWLVSLQTTTTAATAAGATAAAGAAPGAAAATTPGAAGAVAPIGSVTIAAKSTSYDDVAAYLDALAGVPGTSDPYLTSSSRDAASGTPVVSFTVTAQVTPDALSHRFDQPDVAAAPTTPQTTPQQEG